MTDTIAPHFPQRLANRAGLGLEINANGSIRRFDCGNVSIGLFLGNEVEGGPANLYLRRHGPNLEWIPLLGPASPTRFQFTDTRAAGAGSASDSGGAGGSGDARSAGGAGGSSDARGAGRAGDAAGMLVGTGLWLGIRYTLTLVLAQDASAWFWHLRLENTTSDEHHLDIT
jgi:hypothetical protein